MTFGKIIVQYLFFEMKNIKPILKIPKQFAWDQELFAKLQYLLKLRANLVKLFINIYLIDFCL